MKRFLLLVILFFVNINITFAYTALDDLNINLNVDGCNNNSICEPSIGEDVMNCPNDCSVIVPPPPNGGGGGIMQFVYDVTIEPNTNQATIQFKTRLPVFTTIRWGETVENKIGVVHNTLFLRDHIFTIANLNPSTRYYFSIEYQNRDNKVITGYNGTFVTISIPKKYIVPNPFNVRAKVNDQGIMLTWNNPIDPDLDYVRIVRNVDRFHSSPHIGDLIYEGKLEYYLDKDVEVNKKYYYTIFSHETSGEFSSGVGVTVIYNPSEDLPIFYNSIPVQTNDIIQNFIIIQNGQVIEPTLNIREVVGDELIQIESAKSKYQGFQDLWVEIKDSTGGNSRAYLMFYDKERGVYQANIDSLLNKGDYEVRIYGYNQDHTALLGSGILRVLNDVNPKITPKSSDFRAIIISFITIFIIFIFWLIRRNRLKKEE